MLKEGLGEGGGGRWRRGMAMAHGKGAATGLRGGGGGGHRPWGRGGTGRWASQSKSMRDAFLRRGVTSQATQLAGRPPLKRI
jgi:hypothetical protein